MSKLSSYHTRIAALVVVLVFGAVWALAAGDLSPAESLVASLGIAGAVALAFSLLKSAATDSRDRSTRLAELLHRSGDGRRGIRDETTGLLNRWYLERRLDEEAARCKRYGHSMAVVVLKAVAVDLTRFSLDGWQAESAEAARRCASVIRNVDLSAALAPFEFAMCLVHCDRTGAEAAIARITAEFDEYDCQIGIAVFPEDDGEPRALIELARVRSRQMAMRSAA